MKCSLLFIFFLFILAGCQKELSFESERPSKTFRKFQLSAVYSDIPIDMMENDDEIKLETDLWPYVENYLKDDVNIFTDDTTALEVHQNDIKMPGLNDPVLYRKYFIGTDNGGKYMKFLDNEYKPVRYDLVELTDTYFILGIKWRHGATLYSRFERIF